MKAFGQSSINSLEGASPFGLLAVRLVTDG